MELKPAIESAFVELCEKTGRIRFPLSRITLALQLKLRRRGFKPASVRRILFNLRKDGNETFYEDDRGWLCLHTPRISIEDHFDKPKELITTVITKTVITTVTTMITKLV